jgi:alpha-tubulin suppressor-like RCC1 family protein
MVSCRTLQNTYRLLACRDGREGRLGHGDDSMRLKPGPVTALLSQMVHVIAVQAGGAHTVALSDVGEVYTWGCGQSGRLGIGSMTNQNAPVIVAALGAKKVISIAAGSAHCIALTEEGDIFTWGKGELGRLGHGSGGHEILPREVLLSSHSTVRPVAVGAGDCHSCIFR